MLGRTLAGTNGSKNAFQKASLLIRRSQPETKLMHDKIAAGRLFVPKRGASMDSMLHIFHSPTRLHNVAESLQSLADARPRYEPC